MRQGRGGRRHDIPTPLLLTLQRDGEIVCRGFGRKPMLLGLAIRSDATPMPGNGCITKETKLHVQFVETRHILTLVDSSQYSRRHNGILCEFNDLAYHKGEISHNKNVPKFFAHN